MIAADYGGTSDPYCVIRIDGKERWRSCTVSKTVNPVFSEMFSYSLTAFAPLPKDVTLSFYDYDGVGKDDFLGQIVLAGPEIQVWPENYRPET